MASMEREAAASTDAAASADYTPSTAVSRVPEAVALEARGAVRHLRRIRRVPGVTEVITFLDSLTSE